MYRSKGYLKFGFVLGGLAALSLLLSPSRTEATPILDQSQLTIGAGTLGCGAAISGFTVCGQTFTVGITGTLTEIDIYLLNSVGTLDGGLYSFSGTTATLLAASSTIPTFTSAGFYSFLFNRPVTAGDVLNFGIRQDSGDSVVFARTFSDFYGPGATLAFDSNQGLSTFFGPQDAAFRTFVDPGGSSPVPEPASLTLLGVGVAGVGARRWRTRRQS